MRPGDAAGAPPVWFFVLFPALWLGVSTLLSALAGWFGLARAFPDRPDELAILKLRGQSGSMGLSVGMNGILGLSACPTGLRVSMARIFGPFCRPFFVPWSDLRVTRKPSAWWPRVDLAFGSVGHLTVPDATANKLWRAVPEQWPEQGAAPEESRSASAGVLVRQWLLFTAFGSAFFLFAPRLFTVLDPNSRPPPDIPVPVAIGLPAVVFGIGILLKRMRGR